MRLPLAIFALIAAGLGSPPILASAAPAPSAVLQPGDRTVIDKFVASLANQLGGEVPDEVPLAIRTGDLNHDGVPDVAILFTVEGPGNGYAQYLAAFLRINGKLVATDHTAVGGKLYRAIAMTSIQDDAIRFTTTRYAAKDPACCPTIKGVTKYVLADNKLKELPHE